MGDIEWDEIKGNLIMWIEIRYEGQKYGPFENEQEVFDYLKVKEASLRERGEEDNE